MHSLMIVDSNDTELMAIQRAFEQTCSVITMNNGKSALGRLNKSTVMPDLMIIDLEVVGISAFEMMGRIKGNDKMKDISIVIISGDKESSTELEAYRLGASDFIHKPVNVTLLKKRVELQLEVLGYKKQVQSHVNQLQQNVNFHAQNSLRLEYFLIGIITDLISVKDGFTGMHSVSVSKYMGIILRDMMMSGINYGIAPEDYELILLAAQLHDMGKIGVPDSVLRKEGKYTDEEFRQMKNHTIYASNAIEKYAYLLPNNKFIVYTYQMARYHHERFDGNGYPDGLSGQNIPFLARVLAVADVYDALTAKRSYKQATTHEQAYNIISQGAGIQFDPQVVSAFQRAQADIFETAKQMMAQTMQMQAQQAQQSDMHQRMVQKSRQMDRANSGKVI
ncbi:MAG: HD domain-containing protein [Lachnospiraceae bacterium]|nr:HD domain-containing protein [Lachnospiraceae bacterium]